MVSNVANYLAEKTKNCHVAIENSFFSLKKLCLINKRGIFAPKFAEFGEMISEYTQKTIRI